MVTPRALTRRAVALCLSAGRDVARPMTAALWLIATVSAASAADLGDAPYQPRHGSAYDDPRYADIYGDDPPRRAVKPYAAQPYDERHAPSHFDDHDGHDDDDRRAPRRVYRDDDRLPPMRHPPRFSDADRYRDDGCVPRHLVKQRLRSAGWNDFHDLELHGRDAFIRARRPSGRLFELRVDRCSGAVLTARPYGPYATRDRGYSGPY